MKIDEFLSRYGGDLSTTFSGDALTFTLRCGGREQRAPSAQMCLDAMLDDAMDYYAAALGADREWENAARTVEDIRGERRAD